MDPVLLNTGSKLDPLFNTFHTFFLNPKKAIPLTLSFSTARLSLFLFTCFSLYLFHDSSTSMARLSAAQKKNHSHQTLLNNTTIAFIYIDNYSTTNYQCIVHYLHISRTTKHHKFCNLF